ncbi:MAG: type II toxin-antitoxin system VapC family toxin [Beijerinckiaceae bacterium]|jgi:ribonuclease VapC
MFVDACAIVSIIAGEESAVAYESALATTFEAFTSPMAAWEAIIVLSRPDQLNCLYRQAEQVVVEWLAARNIALRHSSTPARILAYAVAVVERYGIGKRALSNFDCFHYAYAKAAGCSLLTFDKLLRETGVDHAP